MRRIARTLLCIAFACFAIPASAQQAPTGEGALDAAIRDFLMRNPKVIRDALAKAELDEQIDRTKRILREQSDAIYRSDSPTIGPADAKVSIVTFYDYNCPYCRKTYALLEQFIAANADVRVVLKDIGNLGKESEAIARLALAARSQGKFQVYHDALMKQSGRMTEASALAVARRIGIDTDQLKAEAGTTKIASALARTRELATSLSVEGTPLFIIGHNGIAGAPDDLSAQLEKFVGEVRKSGCGVC